MNILCIAIAIRVTNLWPMRRCKICFCKHSDHENVGVDKLDIKTVLRNHKIISSEPFLRKCLEYASMVYVLVWEESLVAVGGSSVIVRLLSFLEMYIE